MLKILQKLWAKFLGGVEEVGVDTGPSGGFKFYVKPRPLTKNQSIEHRANSASVFYKIASSFPERNTKPFNFLSDWQVWFLIENRERKTYKAYITIEFFSDGRRERAGGSYDGTNGWNLNALSGVIAPGLGIPPWIREKALQRKPIEIRILCEIKDENDKLLERKLPVEYAYNYENNSWYLNPAPEKRDDF